LCDGIWWKNPMIWPGETLAEIKASLVQQARADEIGA
jgi:hypothetical protein